MDTLRAIAAELLGTSIWEGLGVVMALLYLMLATARSLWCWLCAFISSVCYVVVMWRAGLMMETLLSVFYVVMAIYGWWQWRQGQTRDGELAIVSWTWKQHLIAVLAVMAATCISAWALKYFVKYLIELSDLFGWVFMGLGIRIQSPWLDSLVTWGSVLTTFMVARRVIENWLYWIVVDGVAAYLYFSRDLNATALLFVAYVLMVIYGYFVWRRRMATLPAERLA